MRKILLLLALAAPAAAAAQDTIPVSEAFRRGVAAGTRTTTGMPGPRYWQQVVSYTIRAELDPRTTLLHGSERIVYRNRSPDVLRAIVLNLYQNIYSESVPRNRRAPNTGGVALERVVVQGSRLAEQPAAAIGVMRQVERPAAGYAVDGTLARLMLPRPLAPGDSAVLEIDWHHKVPPAPTFRTAWEDALGGRAFVVGQWYPQVAAYDDVNGWDATPYLGDGEFYLEYGTFTVGLTLPAGWIVGATGALTNREQVLSPQTLQRLERSATSDSVVHVVTVADLASGAALTRPASGKQTWWFSAAGVRDFAFAASDRYLWDVARTRVLDEAGLGYVLPVHALYRPGAPGWDRAWRYGQHALVFLSRLLTPYRYPQATIAEGPIAGMEYPMMVFIHRPESAEDLQSVIAHELGHEWFPMLVGSDEASYAWMDEGVNSYFEDRAHEDFFPGTPPGGSVSSYLRVAGHDNEVPLMRHTDLVSPYGARTVAAYTKPAAVLPALRAVLGDAAFDRALREYVQAWSYKHPQPWDFFNTFERVAGRDLDWFWRPWFFETGVLDQAVESVRPASGGVDVVLRDRGDVAMPAFVTVTASGGAVTQRELPVTAWTGPRGSRTATLRVPVSGAATRVEVDARRSYPDVNRANNVWTGS
ncbi:MAG: M1 family metallopeptidase [Longimicrobiaceae bacterium]